MKIKYLIYFVSLFCLQNIYSQSASLATKIDSPKIVTQSSSNINLSNWQNYIYTVTPTIAASSAENLGLNESLKTVQYFDGQGLPFQAVNINFNPNGHDLASYLEYDFWGRETTSWMPVVGTGNNGKYIDLSYIKRMTNSYFGDTCSYSRYNYDSSPLGRLLEQYGPGQDWHNNQRSLKTFYMSNLANNDTLNCILYTIADMGDTVLTVTHSGDYDTGELYVTKIQDEDDNTSYEFKDKLGQVVLTRQVNHNQSNNRQLLDTYYIYDDFGNLRVVLPPLASDAKNAGTSWSSRNDDILRQYAYLYKYDHRNRCIAKKLPGCDWVLYVFDKADQLIFSQDGEQRLKNEWAFNKYDTFGRIIISGIHETSDTHQALTDKCKDIVVKEKPGGSYGYTWLCLPEISHLKTMTVNYYDDYDHLLAQEPRFRQLLDYFENSAYGTRYINPDLQMKTPKGQLVGTRIKYTDKTDSITGEITTAMYYDNRGRLIQAKSINHLNGIEEEYFAYNFTGQPLKKLHVHTGKDNTSSTKVEELYTYTYDHAGRLTETRHKIDDLPEIILSQFQYDELGRIQGKSMGISE